MRARRYRIFRGSGRATILIIVVTLLLGACGNSADEPGVKESDRPLTSAEADRLAIIRYRNYDRGLIPVKIALHIDDQDLAIAGDVDMRQHRGYATFQASGPASSSGLIQWTPQAVSLLPNGAGIATRPPPDMGWTTRALDPSSSRLDTALAIVLSLAADRPENPLLLQQGGAAYLGTQILGGVQVDVFKGPSGAAGKTEQSHLTYLVDRSGLLRRVVVDLSGNQGPMTIDFLDGEGKKFSLIRELG